MWILNNSKELVSYLHSQSNISVHFIKTFDFSTLYTTIPHLKLNNKYGNLRSSYLLINSNSGLFVNEDTESNTNYTEVQVLQMLDFLINKIFVQCGEQIFQQVVKIPMGTNCALLLVLL